MIYYCCKEITPIKVSISKLLFEEQQKDNNNIVLKPFNFQTKSEKSKKATKSKKKNQSKSTKAPPKKSRVKKANNNNNSFERKKQNNNIKLIDIVKKKRHSIKNKAQRDDESVKSDKVRKRKSIIDYQNEMILKTRENLISMNETDKKTTSERIVRNE